MTTSLAGRVPVALAVILVAIIAGAVVGACSSDDPVQKPPQAFIDATVAGAALSPVCRDVAATRKSLESAVTAVLRLDQEGVEDATAAAHGNLDKLATSAAPAGQLQQVDNLRADLTKFEDLLNLQGISWSGNEVTTQIRWIEDDLAAIENTAGCPA